MTFEDKTFYSLHYEKFTDGSVKCIEDEIPFELPEGWAWARLRSLSVSIGDGDHQPPPQTESGIPFLVISNVSDGKLSFDNTRFVSEAYYNSLPDMRKPTRGDLLFTVTGSYGIPVQVDTDKKFCFQRHIGIIRPLLITNYYLQIVLSSSYIKKLCDEKSTGTAQKTVGLATLRDFLIPISPFEEQKRIHKQAQLILDISNEISSNKSALQTIIVQTKSKILDLAIHGQLVPQNPDDEPASVLLERIRAEKDELIKQGKLKPNKKESIIFKGEDNCYYLRTGSDIVDISDELPYDIPENWTWESLGSLCAVNPRNKLPDDTDVSFIPMPLIEDGFSGRHTSENKNWIEVICGLSLFKNGDIGIAKITPCFENRKSVIFRNLIGGYGAGTTELHILRPYSKEILPEYILALVKSDSFINLGKQAFTGAVGQQRIGKEYVTNTYCALPPVAEQKRIISAIRVYFTQLDKISEALT